MGGKLWGCMLLFVGFATRVLLLLIFLFASLVCVERARVGFERREEAEGWRGKRSAVEPPLGGGLRGRRRKPGLGTGVTGGGLLSLWGASRGAGSRREEVSL